MEPLKQLNQAMAYIEANLAAEIDFARVARMAGCSEYHFRRMFSFLAGLPLGEYIRRRRLSQAAMDLRGSDIRVIDLALKYGYDSPDAFSRAFQRLHGMTPSEARTSAVSLKAVPPMTFQLTIQGGDAMGYRIVEKGAFSIAGIMKQVKLQYEGVNPEIEMMLETISYDDIEVLKAMANVEPTGFIQASTNFADDRADGSPVDHYIGVATSQAPAGKWAVLEVPASTWAVFTSRGEFPAALQNLWARIFAEWFPMSDYELNEGPEILWHESADTSRPDYHSEIWIPVTGRSFGLRRVDYAELPANFERYTEDDQTAIRARLEKIVEGLSG